MNRSCWKYALLVGFAIEQSSWIAKLAAQENLQQSASAPIFGSLEGKSLPSKVIDRSTFSESQWERLALATAAALDPSARFLVPDVSSNLLRKEPSRRAQAFETLVDELLHSERYSQWRAQTWMNDMMSKPAMDRAELLGWSLESYRRWLIESARRNDRFDAFLRMQCIGDEQLRTDQRMLPTAVWYFAGHRSVFDVVELPTPIESNLLRPFRESLDSIIQAEDKDWQRLLIGAEASGGPFEKWYRGELDYPKVSEETLAWQWPDAQSLDVQARVVEDESLIEHLAQPLRASREWTLVCQVDVTSAALDSDLPILIFEQQEFSQDAKLEPGANDRAGRTLRLELVHGHVQVSFVHEQAVSELVLRTKQAISNGIRQIAVVNEGLGGPSSVRLVVDGKPLDLQVDDAEASSGASQKRLWKEIVRGEKARWRITQKSATGIECQDTRVYRLGLSIPELRGLTESFLKSDWESLDGVEKRFWIEHYAKRNDSQWRYQRESRAYYAGNLKSIQESEAMVPVLANATGLVELGARDVFPACLLGTVDVSLQGASQRNLESNLVLSAEEWSKRIGIADTNDKVADRIPEKLASFEVSRTWRNLCRGPSPSPQTFREQSGSQPNTLRTVESARTELVVDKHARGEFVNGEFARVEFVRTADQLELVKHLLLSDAWVSHVLEELAKSN